MNIIIKLILEPDEDFIIKWNNFVLNHPEGNIFQTFEYFRVCCCVSNYKPIPIFAFDEHKNIIGVLLAVKQFKNIKFFKRFTSRSIILGGPLIKNNQISVFVELIKYYINNIDSDIIYSQIRNLPPTDGFKIQLKKFNFSYEERLNVRINLTDSMEKLESKIHKERKRNIRRAILKNVQFKELIEDHDILAANELIYLTYKRLKVPTPPKDLFTVSFKFIKPNNIKYFGAFFNEKLIAARLMLCFKNTVYDWYTGSDSNYYNKYPNDFLPWKIIEWSKDHDYKEFDFGGAGKPNVHYGVRDYKIKFGGELLCTGRFLFVHKPFIYFLIGFIYKSLNGIQNGLRNSKKRK